MLCVALGYARSAKHHTILSAMREGTPAEQACERGRHRGWRTAKGRPSWLRTTIRTGGPLRAVRRLVTPLRAMLPSSSGRVLDARTRTHNRRMLQIGSRRTLHAPPQIGSSRMRRAILPTSVTRMRRTTPPTAARRTRPTANMVIRLADSRALAARSARRPKRPASTTRTRMPPPPSPFLGCPCCWPASWWLV